MDKNHQCLFLIFLRSLVSDLHLLRSHYQNLSSLQGMAHLISGCRGVKKNHSWLIFFESMTGVASEWFIDQEISHWHIWMIWLKILSDNFSTISTLCQIIIHSPIEEKNQVKASERTSIPSQAPIK